MLKKIILASTLCFAILLALAAEVRAQRSQLKETTGSRYKVGQVWGYWTRPHEKNSSFVVLKVEKHPTLGNIVHIALSGLKIKKPQGGFIVRVTHLALTETTIDSSGARLLTEKVDLPDYEEGYRAWREAFDEGRGAVYTISIAYAVEVMEASLNRGALPAGAKGENKILSRRRPFIFQMYRPETNKTEVTAITSSEMDEPGAVMIFPGQLKPASPFQSGILLGSVHYDYEGIAPTGERNARFTFITKRKETYQTPPMFSISVEGQVIHEDEAQLYLNSYEVNSNRIEEQWVTLKVSIDVFMRVAGAKNVEFKIGEKIYKPESFQQKYMSALAKVIKP